MRPAVSRHKGAQEDAIMPIGFGFLELAGNAMDLSVLSGVCIVLKSQFI